MQKKQLNKRIHHVVCALLAMLLQLGWGNMAQGQNNTVGGHKNLWIGVFWPPSWPLTNDEQYSRLHQANVDVLQNTNNTDLSTPERNLRMLDLAKKHGLYISVGDTGVYGKGRQATVNRYKNHKALFGYYIKDEPKITELDYYARVYKGLLDLDTGRVPYVNLFPNFGVEGNYEADYVDQWINLVGARNLKYLSFDHYPFKEQENIGARYFENMETIRKAGLKYGLKTSAYLQAVGITGVYRRPTPAELRFSAYANLAYGIKMPVWFTYYTPLGDTEQFVDAIIDRQGKPTDLYEPFKAVNAEIKALGKELYQLEAEEVYHTDATIPAGTPAMPAGFAWKPLTAGEFIITRFSNRQTGQTFIMIVNKALTQPANFKLSVAAGVKAITGVSNVTGGPAKAQYNKKAQVLTGTLQPGEGRLYAVK